MSSAVIPDVGYARSGDVSIAYQVFGEGKGDLVFVRGFAGDLLSAWEQPRMAAFLGDMASFARVLMIDKRGTGLSDRVREVPTLETRMDDLRAVMDDAGSDRAVIWSAQEGSRLATLFAATSPERVGGLLLIDPSAKGRRTDDYPWALTDGEWRRWLADVREGWGKSEFLDARLAEWAPSMRDDPEFREWFHAHMRRGLSPGSALAFFRMTMDSDVSDLLAAVRVPTVILSSPSQRGPAEFFATRIPSARLVELPTFEGIYTWLDDDTHAITMRETRSLLEGLDGEPAADRVLATVVFTDIVGSSERAAELGDRRWRELLAAHHATVRSQLARFRGEEVDTAGDGFFATFDGPARAIHAACAISDAVDELGLKLRIGVHTGECELHGDRPAGIAVHTGARIAAAARAGEVLVSSTVRDLVAGSGIAFADRGEEELKGVGSWRLYSVTNG